ncbi:hypothetical protein C8J40_11911 [Sphingomonas sp. PP-CC-3A-396]|nr:hypothetical protein C8J40_11911 [Sphingomonas sp. PP-CC-3A-396]
MGQGWFSLIVQPRGMLRGFALGGCAYLSRPTGHWGRTMSASRESAGHPHRHALLSTILQHRQSDKASSRKCRDQIVGAALIAGLEQRADLNADRHRRSIGPGDRRHLLGRIVADLRQRIPKQRIGDRKMPRLMQQVVDSTRLRWVVHYRATLHRHRRQHRIGRHRPDHDRQPDTLQESETPNSGTSPSGEEDPNFMSTRLRVYTATSIQRRFGLCATAERRGGQRPQLVKRPPIADPGSARVAVRVDVLLCRNRA